MIFPAGKRLSYKKNPLDNVIIQFRFTPILDIEEHTPSDFQKEIIEICPGFDEKRVMQQQFSISRDKEVIPSFQIQSPITRKVYVFYNHEKGRIIELSFNALTVTFSQYTNWDDFKNIFTQASLALEKIYNVSLYTRIGLRYIDRFISSKFNLCDCMNWNSLINKDFMGLGGIDENQNINFQNIYETPLSEYNAKAVISVTSVMNTEKKIVDGIVLDYDCSIERNTLKSDLSSRVDYLHVQARNIFEFALTQKLRDAMGIYENDSNDKQ